MTPAQQTAIPPPSPGPAGESGAEPGDCEYLDELAAARMTGDLAKVKAAERALVVRFLPVADSAANSYTRRGIAADDLQQQARLGLVHAVARWQPGRSPAAAATGTSAAAFLAFALPTIRGVIKRYFRDTITPIRRPRSAQEHAPKLRRSVDELSRRLGREPIDEELAAHTGMTAEQINQVRLTAWLCNPLSLDDVTVGAYALSADPGLSRVEDRHALATAWSHLTDRERTVLQLRFWDELSHAEIGNTIGVTQAQVGRILRRTYAKISTQFT
jgi:RNA polymerase sigma-B factor